MKVYFNPYKQFRGCWIPDWLLCRSELSAGTKLCYSRLARFAGKNGYCYPKIETLAETLGVSVAQCKRYLKQLQEFDLIESKQRGMGNSNQYYFLEHEWMSDAVDDADDTTRSITYDTPEVSHMIRPNKESHLRNSIDITEIKQNVIRYFIDKVDGAYEVVPTAELYDNLKTIIAKGYTIEQIKKVIDRKAAQFHRREISAGAFNLRYLFKPANFFTEVSITERPAKPKQRKPSGENSGKKINTNSEDWNKVKSL